MNLIPFSFRTVFSNILYILIAITIAVSFWILLNTFDKLLFFSPVWTFYLPEDAVLGFILTNISSILLGILLSMNIYIIKTAKLKVSNKSSLFSGTTLGIISTYLCKLFINRICNNFNIGRNRYCHIQFLGNVCNFFTYSIYSNTCICIIFNTY